MSLPQLYNDAAIRLGEVTGMGEDVLHIHAGMAILVLARLALRRSLGSFAPFAIVALAQAGNEVMDALAYGFEPAEAAIDTLNTLLWPFAISLGVRLRPPARVPATAAG